MIILKPRQEFIRFLIFFFVYFEFCFGIKVFSSISIRGIMLSVDKVLDIAKTINPENQIAAHR
jgi:hypothetical protein